MAERIPPSNRHDYDPGAVKVYLDDLEKVLGLASQRFSGLEITDDEYRYASLTEILETRGKRPSRLIIRFPESFGTSFNLKLSRDFWGNSFSTTDPQLFLEVQTVLQRCRRRISDKKIWLMGVVPVGVTYTLLALFGN